jgi:FkbM family methyltransferase
MKRNNITKIVLITDLGDKLSVDSSELDKFFESLKINARDIISTLSLRGINKIKMCKILFFAYARKLIKISPTITENMYLSLSFPGIKFNKIVKLEVYIQKKVLYFNLDKKPLTPLLQGIRQVISNNQYNMTKKNIKNKIVLDVGANWGEFSLLAAQMGAKKVYAFEPVSSAAKNFLKNINLNNMQDKIVVIRGALGNKNYFDKIYFKHTADDGARIDLKIPGDRFEKVEIMTLDEFLSKNKIKKVDFIKMDVEGFEENVLIGADKTIKKFKPVLSFSAYHKPTDKKKLPIIVKSMRKDYKITLNKFDDEVFYCF